jgi:alpha-L-fucosidase
MPESDLNLKAKAERDLRMAWWREARFGMFVHWGLYSQIGRHEWVMNRERIPVAEYEKYADTWQVKDRPAREWARLAKQSGMKYMVMTTKHHEGFCLWNTQQTDYNAVKRGPMRDLVAEYVDACREFGLKIGFYYSLMDWHHPDGALCATDEAARRRFLDFTQGCVRELLSNYGKIDILWYDVSWPLSSPELWESAKMNAMARELQPHILINNRSQLDEDFGTPEEHVTAEGEGRDWEACMTFNGSWGYMPYAPAEDWLTTRDVLNMLRTASGGQGNLLLNIGPKPDGSVPEEAYPRLDPVGKWLEANGEAAYGIVGRADGNMEWMLTGAWTVKGNTAYYWCSRWPGSELAIGGLTVGVKKASILASGQAVEFEQAGNRLVLKGLPDKNPDPFAGVTVLKLECDASPHQVLGTGCVVL